MNTRGNQFLLETAHTFIGKELAVTDWVFIDQMQANIFGEVTRWNHWMHSDPARCAEESPYGGTLIHGFMMVALITHFHAMADLRPADAARSLNYGMDKVRVLRPVVIGEGVYLRDRITLLDVEDKGDGKRLFKTANVIEAKGSEEPAIYIEYLNYWFPESGLAQLRPSKPPPTGQGGRTMDARMTGCSGVLGSTEAGRRDGNISDRRSLLKRCFYTLLRRCITQTFTALRVAMQAPHVVRVL